MKKTINILLSMFMIAVLTASFTGCGGGEDDPTPPTVTVSQDVTSAWRADTVTFTVSMSTNEKLSELMISSDYSSQNETITEFTGDNSASYEYKFVIPGSVSDGDYITITFKCTDNKGESTTVTANIDVTETTVSTPFDNEVTSGTFYHIAGLLHGAYDMDGDATVSSSGAASTKSMINNDAAGSAFTGSWTSGNSTNYVQTTTAYADVDQETAASIYSAGSPTTDVASPSAGDVYVAMKGSTYYVIEILTVEPSYSTGTGGNTGRITFKYKK